MSLSKIKLTNSCTPSHQTYKISFQECCKTNLGTKNPELIRAPVYFRAFKFQFKSLKPTRALRTWIWRLICHGIQPFSKFAANKITRIMKWGISPSSEMPHFLVYFSTRTVIVCLPWLTDKLPNASFSFIKNRPPCLWQLERAIKHLKINSVIFQYWLLAACRVH